MATKCLAQPHFGILIKPGNALDTGHKASHSVVEIRTE